MPAFTNPTASTVVADELWTSPVSAVPAANPAYRFFVT